MKPKQQGKTVWDFIRSKKFLYNVFGVIAFYGVFILLFALFVRSYTNHGESIHVPDVRGKSFGEAIKVLDDRNLHYEISDSMFNDSKPPLTVIEQNPSAKTSVKEYRTIYLTVNSKTAPSIALPDLKDVSLKQASLILQSYGLKVGALSYKPDLAKDVVLAMSCNGEQLKTGSSVKKGCRIDLMLGDGLGRTQVEVPNLVGLSLREARFVLDGSSLTLGAMVIDGTVRDDTLSAVVYKQVPDALTTGRMMNIGEGVDVFLTSPQDYNSKQKD